VLCLLAVNAEKVALGFASHTGWAAVVAVAGSPGNLQILDRRRIELLPNDGSLPRFAYHQAAELSLPAATQLIHRVGNEALARATLAVQTLVEEIRGSARVVVAAGLPAGGAKVPDKLADILRSHSLIHAAEGRLSRQALAAAAESRGLCVIQARERDLWLKAAEAFKMAPDAFRALIDGHGRHAGSPWGADQKIATAAALFALSGDPG